MKKKYIYAFSALLLSSACGEPEKTALSETDQKDNSAEVKAYYDARPDFFRFKTLADLPERLTWENGNNLSEMGSPEAKKGGTEYRRIQDFPSTLRTVGPDSNGSFDQQDSDLCAPRSLLPRADSGHGVERHSLLQAPGRHIQL